MTVQVVRNGDPVLGVQYWSALSDDGYETIHTVRQSHGWMADGGGTQVIASTEEGAVSLLVTALYPDALVLL